VSLTGIAQRWSLLSDDEGSLLREASEVAKKTNIEWAKKLGINPAKRIGCVKPSGTTSALLGTTSGIHAAHAEFYLRRVRIETNSPIAAYLLSVLDYATQKKEQEEKGMKEADGAAVKFFNPFTTSMEELADRADECDGVIGLPLIETDVYSRPKPDPVTGAKPAGAAATTLVITMPISMEGAIVRSKESAVELLERAALIHRNFIQPTHTAGPNFHNVSLTVNYKPRRPAQADQEADDGEEGVILEWLLDHTDCYAGIALFPDLSAGSTSAVKYPQLPFEEVDETTYEEWFSVWNKLGNLAIEQQKKKRMRAKEDEGESREEKEGADAQDPLTVLCQGMSQVAWDPSAVDKRKEILACAGGNCEYT
jgi:hypothetical protein